MSSPLFAHGEATITPPIVLEDEKIEVGDWFVTDDGAILRYIDDEGYGRQYDDDLAEIVGDIARRGSKVNGAFEWECEGEFGKTVIRDNKITEYAGFIAYGDNTTENESTNVIQVSSKIDLGAVVSGLQRAFPNAATTPYLSQAIAILEGKANTIH